MNINPSIPSGIDYINEKSLIKSHKAVRALVKMVSKVREVVGGINA
jgi:hypothetical protein